MGDDFSNLGNQELREQCLGFVDQLKSGKPVGVMNMVMKSRGIQPDLIARINKAAGSSAGAAPASSAASTASQIKKAAKKDKKKDKSSTASASAFASSSAASVPNAPPMAPPMAALSPTAAAGAASSSEEKKKKEKKHKKTKSTSPTVDDGFGSSSDEESTPTPAAAAAAAAPSTALVLAEDPEKERKRKKKEKKEREAHEKQSQEQADQHGRERMTPIETLATTTKKPKEVKQAKGATSEAFMAKHLGQQPTPAQPAYAPTSRKAPPVKLTAYDDDTVNEEKMYGTVHVKKKDKSCAIQ